VEWTNAIAFLNVLHTHFLENDTNICTHKYSAYLSEISHFPPSCPTHNTHISETTWRFSAGKRDNFIKEQLHIRVISFNKLSGGELYELLVPHVQVSLNARTKHVHLFHCSQKHPSNRPAFDTKG